MTAEVAIANATAVALAADSAVTIGRQKIYNSALKVFALSKVAPVGVMIYGNAQLMDVPWEVLIKTFREEIGNKTLPHLKDYSRAFVKYVADHTEYFPKSTQAYWMEGNIRGYYRLIREEFFKNVRSQFSSANGNLTDQQINAIFAANVSEHHVELSSKEFADGITKKFEEDFRARHLEKFKKLRDEVFEKLPIESNVAKLLNDIAVLIHSRKVYSQNLSGVVVAGYGENEIYPSVISHDIEGVVDNTLKYAINEKKSGSITGGSECQIIPFAQDDMVATFMNGINPELLNFLSSYLTETFRRLPDIFLAKSAAKKLKKNAAKDVAKLLDSLFDDLKNHLQDVHISPVLNMVTVLPKDELAEMAESLVNLTAFKRRMTDSVETVGGPIDVAVISKGDGLVWIKRKHYFPQELNQHFFRNYFRGIRDGKTT